jgi:flagellar secretion chaperone FliS
VIMDQHSAASAYQKSAARGASAVGQVVSLYDTILRDFRRALVAIEAGNVEARVFELNHSLTVIGELQGVLDFQRGGESAAALESFYNATRPMIIDANARVSRKVILDLIDMYQGMRQAWQQVEQKLPHSEPKIAGPKSAAPARPLDAEPSGNGNWSA